MKIYTKRGDFGETSLYGGKRVPKTDLQIEAYGTVDELNCFIGLALTEINELNVKRFLEAVQNDLMSISSYLAGFDKDGLNLELRVSEIEKVIDEIDKQLKPLHEFIIPGGKRLGAGLHICRAVARRCERRVIHFYNQDKINPLLLKRKKSILSYLNRVSDLLFVLARFANLKDNWTETVWEK